MFERASQFHIVVDVVAATRIALNNGQYNISVDVGE